MDIYDREQLKALLPQRGAALMLDEVRYDPENPVLHDIELTVEPGAKCTLHDPGASGCPGANEAPFTTAI